jgi:energy-coupling factor transport system ATP-binding protein
MLETTALSFSYKRDLPCVLKDVNLTINKGEKILIAGKNGSGKTTLSKILSGLIPHAENGVFLGSCRLKGKELQQFSRLDIVKKISVLFQDFESQIVSTAVLEELLFYPLNIGISFQSAKDKAQKLTSDFGVSHLVEKEIGELSGGEKQKIALLSLLLASPEYIILDEPFTDIDPASQRPFLEYASKINNETSVIMMEQSLDYYEFFDRIIILHDGSVRYNGDISVVSDKKLLSKCGLVPPGIFAIPLNINFSNRDGLIGEIRQNYIFNDKEFAKITEPQVDPVQNKIIIETKKLSYSYPESRQKAVKDIDLKITKGDCIALIGHNGSGKTTLMKLIAGIIPHNEGIITYKGQDIKKERFCGTIGFIYQNPDTQIFAESVYREISFILEVRGLEKDFINSKTLKMLNDMGLIRVKDADPFTLPKGDREKVACSSILVGEPEVLILDEPTTGLDSKSLENMMRIIMSLNESGTTVLMITHSMETVARYAKNLIVMSEGSLIYRGSPRVFFSNDEFLSAAKIERTPVMNASLEIADRLLLTPDEFSACFTRSGPG